MPPGSCSPLAWSAGARPRSRATDPCGDEAPLRQPGRLRLVPDAVDLPLVRSPASPRETLELRRRADPLSPLVEQTSRPTSSATRSEILHVHDQVVPEAEGLAPGCSSPVCSRPGEQHRHTIRALGDNIVEAEISVAYDLSPPNCRLENLPGLVWAASGGRGTPKSRPASASTPFHVRMNERDERLNIAGPECLVRGSDLLHARHRTPAAERPDYASGRDHGSTDHVSRLRRPEGRTDAAGRVPTPLPLRRLRRSSKAAGRRLLRLLLVCRREVSADASCLTSSLRPVTTNGDHP